MIITIGVLFEGCGLRQDSESGSENHQKQYNRDKKLRRRQCLF